MATSSRNSAHFSRVRDLARGIAEPGMVGTPRQVPRPACESAGPRDDFFVSGAKSTGTPYWVSRRPEGVLRAARVRARGEPGTLLLYFGPSLTGPTCKRGRRSRNARNCTLIPPHCARNSITISCDRKKKKARPKSSGSIPPPTLIRIGGALPPWGCPTLLSRFVRKRVGKAPENQCPSPQLTGW